MRASSVRRAMSLTSAKSAASVRAGTSNAARIFRSSGTVTAGAFFPHHPPLQQQVPQRQQRQRHMVVPAHPTAHLVLPQPHLPLGPLEQLLHRVPPLLEPRQRRPPPPP